MTQGLSLVDDFLNRVVTLPVNFYQKGVDVTFSCNVYNSTAVNISNVYITTSSLWNGFVSAKITGGDWQNITSNIDTTCLIGTITSGGLLPIQIKINISISAGISGSNVLPLFITQTSQLYE